MNKHGCTPKQDVCMTHSEPLACKHGCMSAIPHKCSEHPESVMFPEKVTARKAETAEEWDLRYSIDYMVTYLEDAPAEVVTQWKRVQAAAEELRSVLYLAESRGEALAAERADRNVHLEASIAATLAYRGKEIAKLQTENEALVSAMAADEWLVTRADIDKACQAYNDQSMQLADAQYVCMGKALEAVGLIVDWG